MSNPARLALTILCLSRKMASFFRIFSCLVFTPKERYANAHDKIINAISIICMANHFTNLHVHTEFSLLDGAISLERFIAFGKQHQMQALAITDHGNIFGAVKFFQECKKVAIKPIIGMEAYFTDDVTNKSVEKKYHHLILLVQNEIGYKNLCKLISFSFKEGFYFKPRIDYQILERHAAGLIATTACLGGHIPSLLMEGNEAQAQERMDWFLRVFGPERFYLEVQPEDQQEQKVLNEKLLHWGQKKGINCVATSDCHYVSPDDHEAHEVMLSIQTHHKITDPDRFTFGACRAYIRTADDMLAIFPDHPEVVWNSGIIADQCNFEFQTNKLYFPHFVIPPEHTSATYFKYLSIQGLERLIAQELIDTTNTKIYWQRLELEMELIIKMGFIEYFLVVSDFIQWAKAQAIPVGPGRGSAAGSLVAWALQITNIDPLKYNLLFERFLNPERITMPDIDIDFCIEGRDRVIQYVRERYGHDKVCQIITFGTMLAKGVVKDVARVLGISFEDSNMITNLIPDQLKITLKEAIEQEPRLGQLIQANPQVKKLFDLAFRLEGITRHASKHAAGIVISPEPIDEVLPVYVPPKTTDLVTQYAMTELEYLGFLKIDFLGLKNLTLIDRVLKTIARSHNVHINIDKLPLNDTATFALLCKGNTSGVFQLESEGIKDVLRKLQPDKFEDIIAVNALYRPGPLGSGMVDDYIERRHGRQKIHYLFQELEPILQETYGVIVYQEQVMKIASAIAGYSLGEADILRRAMGKKKADVMAAQKELFVKGAIAHQFDAQKAGELFELMAYFAGYGFNKSHSAAYALIAYHTAYLKAHYPAEFMAELISLEAHDADKMTFYLQEAKGMGLQINPPNINSSGIDFTVQEGSLLFGLRGIKNVGLAALENIIQERAKKPFNDLLDFCTRVDLRTVNKRVAEHLIAAGAFDLLPGNRAQKYDELPLIMEQAIIIKKAQQTGQMGLFGHPTAQLTEQSLAYQFQARTDWDTKTKLEKELEVMGLYLSAHPLSRYQKYQEWLNIPSFAQILQTYKNVTQEPVVIGYGLVTSFKVITTKKGERMAFVSLEDTQSKAEIVLFPSIFKKVEPLLEQFNVFLVRGPLDITTDRVCKIKANEFIPLDTFFEQSSLIKHVSFILPPHMSRSTLEQIKTRFRKGGTAISLIVREQEMMVAVNAKEKIAVDFQILSDVEEVDVRIVVNF